MRNIALIVSYDGTDYYGFQSQPGGNTVQDKLEEAIYKLSGEEIRLNGSGRTDAGVHARCQVASFTTNSTIPTERWAIALNTRLPQDIVVQSVYQVPDEFHARHHALNKTYRYTINCNRVRDLFRRRYEVHHPTPLDVEAMRAGLKHLIGEHDFSSFTSPLSTKPSHVRTILESWIELEEAEADNLQTNPAYDRAWDERHYPGKQRGVLHLYVKGSGFLYNMVRIIAGTLLQVGEGKIAPEEMARILAARDRAKAGPTAMPNGLSLWEVVYEDLPIGRRKTNDF
ncbi:tRNA pseudouridine(38-40) synthase TruA [Cohnella boryungensis]|uniref:tRNA pseudouridine synthase A n=1 Tax=Cohnella boryungensis TaxID=768479 RepID=A0ABV8SAW7_9BACL